MWCCNRAFMWNSAVCCYINSFSKVSSPPHSFYKKTHQFTPLVIWLYSLHHSSFGFEDEIQKEHEGSSSNSLIRLINSLMQTICFFLNSKCWVTHGLWRLTRVWFCIRTVSSPQWHHWGCYLMAKTSQSDPDGKLQFHVKKTGHLDASFWGICWVNSPWKET